MQLTKGKKAKFKGFNGFNTASGKYYCNYAKSVGAVIENAFVVSIPQAVSTIAIVLLRFAVISLFFAGFNTASGKYYCNSRPYKASIHGA